MHSAIGLLRSTAPVKGAALGSTSLLRSNREEQMLLEACRRGDPAAWNTLIGRYQKPVYKFAYSLCGNHDDAADIAGQVFLRVFENLHSFRNESSFTSWLFRIVRNVYVDTCIRAPHRAHLSLDDGFEVDGETMLHEVPDTAPTPEQHCLERERRDMLRKAISHLPRYQRRMVQMYHTEGRSYEEIASETGLSLGTVKSRLSRARHMLRERLRPFQDQLVAA